MSREFSAPEISRLFETRWGPSLFEALVVAMMCDNDVASAWFAFFGPKVPSDNSASFSMPWMFPRSMGSTSLSITIGDLVTLTGRRQNLTDTITTSSYLMAQKCRQRAPASEFLSLRLNI